LTYDIKLLGYAASAMFFFMAIMLLLTLRQVVRVRGATQWLWSTIAVAVGIALNTSQELLPPFFGITLSNALLIAGSALAAAGTFAYRYQKPPPLRWVYLLFVALAALFVLLQPYLAARILVVAVVTGCICTWHAWMMLAGSKLRPHSSGVKHGRFALAHGVMVLGLLMIAAVFAIRAVDTWFALQNTQNSIPLGGPQRTALLFYSVGMAGRLLLLIGMMLLLIDELDFELRTLALRDPLTGLFNRRGLIDTAPSHALATCCLLMLDLDFFKAVNDDFGHDQGDRVIVLLARCGQTHLPANAVLARLGGEEFCALLPACDEPTAVALAERLRQSFAHDSEALSHGRQHTVSIGVSCAQQGNASNTLSALMARADQALYRAKRDGRNRVEVMGAAPQV
jgi:diguanylate cyclase (GGDEF)-like protein